ncbi:TraB/GumN family protein [Microbulbifer magnicolonia]|uniref:TraB/GumN family protein n=1 Tax=Microbulbifer magnicolonia TaxID=3109744 RepID=UPI002B40239A|nr:TraB/GumN family protein [Microbulbifer sp. GG15]
MANPNLLRTLCVFLLVIAGITSAAETDRGIFWRADKAGQTVYLLGSVHLATPDFYPLRASIERAYAASDALVVEADILAAEGDMALQQRIMMESLYPGDRSLRDDLSPAVFKQLQSWLEQRQLPESLFIRQRPAIAMITMSMVEMRAQGLDPGLGIDRHFLKKAKRQGKPIVELEGVLQQLQLLNELENPGLLLQQTLAQLKDIETFVPRITSAWKAGDIDTLYRLIIADNLAEYPEFAPLYETLFFRRNRAMADKIADSAPAYKSLFVIVGAGHLIGNESVIELLKKEGYQLQRL